jgi:hypothetical protein
MMIDEPVALADVLAALRALPPILVRLADALERQDRPRVEPLVYRREEFAAALRISLVTFDRLRSAGRIPPPSLRLASAPAWTVQAVREWLAQQASRGGRP